VSDEAKDAHFRRIAMFRRVSADDRAALARVSHVVTYARGDLIFMEGAPADTFLSIAEGRVKVFKATPAGKEIILEIFGAGDPLGAVAAYEGGAFPASAQALEPTTCLCIERGAMYALLEQRPALVRALLSGLTLRLAELIRRLADLTGARVEARFARLFLKLADQIGRPEHGGEFVPMPLSRQELADLTGTTIETAIRLMSRWEKEEVLHTQKDGFVVRDRQALEDAAS
jgi:CRP-like cAMP-binding protein